jgi:hypothetical protein
MEDNTVNQRLAKLVEHFAQGNKSAFAKSIGISSQGLGEILGGRQSTPSFSVLQKLFTSYPQVRIQWLMLGEGKMLNDSMPIDDNPNTPGLLIVLKADLDVYNKKLVHWQNKLAHYQSKQELIDLELAFLHQLPDVDGVEDELFGRSMLFAESMSEQNQIDIESTESEIYSIHERLAAIHKRIAECLEPKPSAVASHTPPPPKRSTSSPSKSKKTEW